VKKVNGAGVKMPFDRDPDENHSISINSIDRKDVYGNDRSAGDRFDEKKILKHVSEVLFE
jgi:hypothetical protein